MHLLRNIWSDVSVMETESQTERERDRKTEKGQAGKREKISGQ